MELRHLRYFVAVADERHFGRAAVRLHISQPPLSQQIRDLERELGVPLFERGRGGVRLTSAGRLFDRQARAMLAQAERAVAEARRVGRGQAGRLEIGFTGSLPFTDVFARGLQRFRQRYAGVELHLQEMGSVEQIEALAASRLDLGLLRIDSRHLPVGLAGEALSEEPLMAALPRVHPLARRTAVSLRHLADEPWLAFAPSVPGGLPTQIEQLTRAAGFAPNIVQRVHEMPTMIGLVAAGVGIALVAASMRRIRLPGVVFRPLTGLTPRLRPLAVSQVMLLWQPPLPPAASNFVAAVHPRTGR
ncbi:MAG: LysR family transcriptional regulator [Gammaproteobacteria bacterium]|nr:LysR family transcriptional regulator [Gammaproteobacteria bacterium]